jgi:hypothetical protein
MSWAIDGVGLREVERARNKAPIKRMTGVSEDFLGFGKKRKKRTWEEARYRERN